MNPIYPKFEKVNIGVTEDNHPLLTFSFTLAPDTIYLQGHFPGAPILPGVTQLDWAIQLAADHWGTDRSVQTVEVLKFNDMILPEALITLTLQLKRENCVVFRYSGRDASFSSGRLIYSDGKTV
ncbi:3-hydroxymyristoyl-ACP dehydratase [Pseudidiomarina salinarum]|uniref:3-hydroxymyristoyl-ACP dehydratase n=1 Tax=Pseudidiomarina salinarum TaxID=435908 RepID=A0A094IUS8_9GAMM|nr:3-hydroxymyristoyl-ACP dehydratase [Pseudidiomarina salinarum]